jgi:hypothetical protein
VSSIIRTPSFQAELSAFLRERVSKSIIRNSVEVDHCNTLPGDPADLVKS